jgi:hypothetical protein
VARLVIAGVVGLVLLGFCAFSLVTTYVIRPDAPLKTGCDVWLNHLEPRWVVLSGCVLDVDLVVVESDAGDFEKLANRQKGLSLKPYPVPPTWVAAWIPVRTELQGAGLVRAAWRTESQDLLKWVNALERADERQKERMWADQTLLRRFSRPGVLPGKAGRPESETLQKAFGSSAAASLLAVLPGTAPPPEVPAVGIFAGLAGLVLLVYVIRSATRPAHLDEATVAQALTQVNVSDVKLELGALEQLRDEERQQRKRKRD